MSKLKNLHYYIITIERSKKFRGDNIDNIKRIIKQNTGKSIIEFGVDGNILNQIL